LTESNIREITESAILEDYAPSSVLINEKYEILYFQGPTDRYLSPPIGGASLNILKMAREELRYNLSILLHNAVKQKKTTLAEGLKMKYNDHLLTIDLKVKPLLKTSAAEDLLLVVFEDKTPQKKLVQEKKKATQTKEVDPRTVALEQELKSTKEYLQTTVEELETSNEELKSTNEELQSTNEEMQSTNEESWKHPKRNCSPPTRSWLRSIPNSRIKWMNWHGPTMTSTIFLPVRKLGLSFWMPTSASSVLLHL
jgi:two-component system CheB/CheR fusion protein